MDVTDWLRRLDLERYAAAFRENDVGVDLLPSLTAEDLSDLGVTSVGHRLRLLEAIRVLQTGPQTSRATTAGRAGVGIDAASTSERRQLTVLFCDIVGSTSMSARLDPEDLRALLTDYQTRVADAVCSKRGYVARFVGDGVMSYFGWPNADEAHAESGVRAALAIIDSLRPQNISVRIGMATGLVVTGDLEGIGAAQTLSAVGQAPNLAARLQSFAQPNTVVVSDSTRAQLGGVFALSDLGTLELKGFDAPQRAWKVERATALSSRSEALHASRVMPLIGRFDEVNVLLGCWREAKSGHGRVLLLSGEAGIGKSRLLAELEQRLAAEPHHSLRYFCSQHSQDSALFPIIARWDRDAGFAPDDSAEERLRKLESLVSKDGFALGEVAHLAALLSIPTAAPYPPPDLSPQRAKARTFSTLVKWVETLALRRPVVLFFEDAHWADPSSIELLQLGIERLTERAVFMVISFRPEFRSPWAGHPSVSALTLSRLDQRHSEALALQVKGRLDLPQGTIARILALADGVPLFIEELTKAMMERRAAPSESDTLALVPETLHASLMARLDRIPIARQVAQTGAVIGREFAHALLAALGRPCEPQLAAGVNELVASGLAERRK